MSVKLTKTLKKSMLFTGFSEKQLKEVVANMKPRQVTLKSGDRLYKRGDSSDCCWLIQSGHLTVQRASLRAPFRKMVYHEGSVTGIQGLADPGSQRSVTMIAEDKVELIEITHDGITTMGKDTQILLWENVARLMLRKLAACLSRESLDS